MVYLADAASYLAFVPVLARLRLPAPPSSAPANSAPDPARPQPGGFREVLRDKAFVRVWMLTALIVTLSFGQYQASFAGDATRPGGISAHGLLQAGAHQQPGALTTGRPQFAGTGPGRPGPADHNCEVIFLSHPSEKYESEQARSEHRKGAVLADLRSALEGELSGDLDAQVLAPRPAGNAQKGAMTARRFSVRCHGFNRRRTAVRRRCRTSRR